MDLIDPSVFGNRFTWFSGDGKSMSRIDRFLVDSAFINRWGMIGQSIGKRDISEHCPIWMKIEERNWGPKLFKTKNSWFDHPHFIKFFEENWRSYDVVGRSDFMLKEKFKMLRGDLKIWSKEVFGWYDLKVKEEVDIINKVEMELIEAAVKDVEGLVARRSEACKVVWHNLHVKDNLII
ncbi:unnamed protein product [Lathyrus sativus]|nr:unnamed protein product [Lathyrus sativus]